MKCSSVPIAMGATPGSGGGDTQNQSGQLKLQAPKAALSVLERAQRYLQRCPPAVSGQFGHSATFRVACVLVHGFALPEGEALTAMREWNQRCRPPWEEADLVYKLKSAAATPSSKPIGYLRNGSGGASTAGCQAPVAVPASSGVAVAQRQAVRRRKAVFRPETLRRVAARAPQVDEAFVRDRSPVCPETQSPASFLHRLYRPGEHVVVFDRKESQGVILEWSGPPYDARCLDHWVNGCPEGVLFLANPVDGESHPNPRQGGKPSCRSMESVVAWRYMLLESDKADPREWLAALAQMPLRIAAIYTSGGRSIHALVRVDAASKAEWDAVARRLKPFMTTLGGDPGAITAVRLTRLPGCYRGQTGPRAPRLPPTRRRWVDEPLEFDAVGDPIWTPPVRTDDPPAHLWTGGRLQELLYLNPEPDTQRIVDKPTRQQMHAAWLSQFRHEKAEVGF